MPDIPDSRSRLPITLFVAAAAALALALAGVLLLVLGPRLTAGPAKPQAAAPTPMAAVETGSLTALVQRGRRQSVVITSTPAAVESARAKVAARTAPAARPAPKADKIAAYRGLGSWIDIYEDAAWANPSQVVRDMYRRGVKTLYLETANSRSPSGLKDPAAMATFIDEAHAHGMRVVAWYLPDLGDVTFDEQRVASAIKFKTSKGGRFDSFALDIESGAVPSVGARNAALMDLTKRIRARVGSGYPLGAIIPSPVGLSRGGSYWGDFPYTALASTYDVFVPMSYYTYHGKGGAAVAADTAANMKILRSKKGCGSTPVHLIGGIAEVSTADEVNAFTVAAIRSGAVGGSLYSWTGTTAPMWKALGQFDR